MKIQYKMIILAFLINNMCPMFAYTQDLEDKKIRSFNVISFCKDMTNASQMCKDHSSFLEEFNKALVGNITNSQPVSFYQKEGFVKHILFMEEKINAEKKKAEMELSKIETIQSFVSLDSNFYDKIYNHVLFNNPISSEHEASLSISFLKGEKINDYRLTKALDTQLLRDCTLLNSFIGSSWEIRKQNPSFEGEDSEWLFVVSKTRGPMQDFLTLKRAYDNFFNTSLSYTKTKIGYSINGKIDSSVESKKYNDACIEQLKYIPKELESRVLYLKDQISLKESQINETQSYAYVFYSFIDSIEVEIKEKREQNNSSFAWTIFTLLIFSLAVLLGINSYESEVQKMWIKSGQVIQFLTITMILVVTLSLGTMGKLNSEILGTLIGGISGYVLSQNIGRKNNDTAE